jgi:hypothetical protein
MAAPPPKKLRIDRIILLLLLLTGAGVGVYLLMTR